MTIVADLEADGLLDNISKIHCFSYYELVSKKSGNITDYNDLIDFLTTKDLVIIGHNFTRYDKPALEKVLEMKFNFRIIDTLPLSWTLFPKNKKHGLESWGEFFGVKKPEIKSFAGISDEKLEIIKYFEEIYPHEKL